MVDSKSGAVVPLSKNAQKRLLKRELSVTRKAQRKAKEKAERDRLGEVRRDEHRAKMAAMTEEERVCWHAAKQAKLVIIRKATAEGKARISAALSSPHGISSGCNYSPSLGRTPEPKPKPKACELVWL